MCVFFTCTIIKCCIYILCVWCKAFFRRVCFGCRCYFAIILSFKSVCIFFWCCGTVIYLYFVTHFVFYCRREEVTGGKFFWVCINRYYLYSFVPFYGMYFTNHSIYYVMCRRVRCLGRVLIFCTYRIIFNFLFRYYYRLYCKVYESSEVKKRVSGLYCARYSSE